MDRRRALPSGAPCSTRVHLALLALAFAATGLSCTSSGDDSERIVSRQLAATAASGAAALRTSVVFGPDGVRAERSLSGATSHSAVTAPGQLIVKLRSTGPRAVTECAERWVAEGRSFRDATADASDSLDRLNRQAGVRRARALVRARVGLPTADALVQERQQLDRAAARATPRAGLAATAALPGFSNVYVLEVAPDADIRALARDYGADAHVEYAQPNYVIKASFTPNDPFYGSRGSWGQAEDDLWGLKKIATSTAWDLTQGAGVVVGVVDTGVDLNHPDLASNIWTNPGEIAGNGIDDDHNGYVDDVHGENVMLGTNDVIDRFGHGTHVAGTIAAVGNNAAGVIGVAPKAKIMPVKAFDDSGLSASDSLAAGVRYAAMNGASVINNSWGCAGGCPTNPLVEDAVRFAHGLGVVVVFAAGNDTLDTVGYSPQNQPEPIVVSATDPSDQITFFSNFGLVDVGAPGGSPPTPPPTFSPQSSILSLKASVCSICDGLVVGTSYLRLSGTSMAAPHVSGVAALVRALHPEYSAEQVRQAIRHGADDAADPGFDTQVGYGRVNAQRALADPAPLEALITSAFDTINDSAVHAIAGNATGPGFAQFTLAYGAGLTPTSWTTFATSTTAVASGTLGSWDTGAVADGDYTLRLDVVSTDGRHYEDRQRVVLDRVQITDPAASALQPPGLSAYVAAGQTVTVRGTVDPALLSRYDLRIRHSDGSLLSGAAVVLTGNGQGPVIDGVLATWDTTGVPVDAYTLALDVTSTNGSVTEETRLVAVDPQFHPGWPRDYTPWGFPGEQPVAADINRDGRSDIVLLATVAVHVLNDQGNELPGWPQTVNPDNNTAYSLGGLAVGDLDGDGSPEIAAANRFNQVFVWHADGTMASGWPRTIGNAVIPQIADVDGDGRNELVLPGVSSVDVVSIDGTSLPGWPATLDIGAWYRGGAVADLDGDGKKEVVVVDSRQTGNMWVLRSNGSVMPGWPRLVNTVLGIPDSSVSTPMVADLDGDGALEIVVGSRGGQVYAFRYTGALVSGWPQQPQSAAGSNTAAIGDLDGDGRPEIVIGYGTLPDKSNVLYAFRADGTILPGWPVSNERAIHFTYFGYGAPILADADGDGRVDVIVASDSSQTPSFALHAYRFDGTPVAGFPKPTFAIGAFPTDGAAVADFDGDGRLELAWVGYPSFAYLWDFPTAATPGAAPWPMFGQDPGHSGAASGPPTSSVHIGPAADAYVRDGSSAGANFGTATTLDVKTTSSAGNNRRAFLRFPLASITSPVGSAKLRLYGKRPTANATTDAAFAVSSNSWTETGLTWNNQPALGAKQGASVTVTTSAGYYEWDVTSFVRSSKAAGASAASFAVVMDQATNDSPDSFSSREAATNRPELLVVTSTNAPPTVATAASASPAAVTGTATALSVLGADDGGEAALIYTWATTGTPPAAVTFSPNGTNAAKQTTATFTAAGSYGLQVTIRDAGGQTVTSTVAVTVSQTLTSVVVTPASATVAPGGTQAFTAAARDQFGVPLTAAPTFTWTVSGGGTITPGGLFTAGGGAGGPFTVTAAAAGKSGTAIVTVSSGSNVTLPAAADATVRDGSSAGSNFGTATTLEVKTTSSSGNNRRVFIRFSLSGLGGSVRTAKLRLHGHRPTSSTATDSVFAVSSTTWSETALTWNNQPALGARQGTGLTIATTTAYYEWDVTTYLKARLAAGDTAVTFAVAMDQMVNDSPDTFDSREGSSASRPGLAVTTGP